jgi:signal transduction histidine kinase
LSWEVQGKGDTYSRVRIHQPCFYVKEGKGLSGARPHTSAIHLTVQDTGAGITPVDLPHVFDRFYRGDAARETDEGESGLGLAIAKSLVEAHGGTISVSSTRGEGTALVIALPSQPRATPDRLD